MHDPFLLIENHNNTELQHYEIVSFGTRHNKAHIITQLKQDTVYHKQLVIGFPHSLFIRHKPTWKMFSYGETSN